MQHQTVRSVLTILTGVVVFIGSGCLNYGLNRFPDTQARVPAEWADEPIIILSDSIVLELQTKGDKNELLEKHYTLYKINSPENGLLKYINEWSNEYLQNRPKIKATALYKNNITKSFSEVDRGDEKELENPYSLIEHKGAFLRNSIAIPNYSQVHYLYVETTQQQKKVEYFSTYIIRHESFNTVKRTITFSRPSGFSITTALENNEGVMADRSVTYENESTIETVIGKFLPKLIDNEKHKYPETWFAAYRISLPPNGKKSLTWEQLGRYQLKEISDSLSKESDSFLDSIAQTISGRTEDEIIEKTYNYVRDNIRYYRNEAGAFGWIPRAPKTVFKNGFGDCKEMAVFLALLLKKKGIQAWFCDVRTEGFQLSETIPACDYFDHVITCVNRKSKGLLYLDATAKTGTWKTSHYWVLGQKTLILSEKGPIIDTISPETDYVNKIVTSSIIEPGPNNGSWTIRGEVSLFGEAANWFYCSIENARTGKREDIVRDLLKQVISISGQKVTLDSCGPDFAKMGYSAGFDACVITSPARGIAFNLPDLYTPNYWFSDLAIQGDRYLSQIEQIDTWTVPEEYNTPVFTALQGVYGQGSWERTGTKITRHYRCGFASVPKKDRDDLKKYLQERNTFARGVVWVK